VVKVWGTLLPFLLSRRAGIDMLIHDMRLCAHQMRLMEFCDGRVRKGGGQGRELQDNHIA